MQWHIFKFWDSNHNHSSFICELDVRYHVKCFSCSPHEASTVGNWGLERFTLLKVTVMGCFRISVALSLSKVHSLISSMKVRVDWWRSRLGDGAELESNFSLHHRPKLLLWSHNCCEQNSNPSCPDPNSSTLDCHAIPPKYQMAVLSFLNCQKQLFKETDSQD